MMKLVSLPNYLSNNTNVMSRFIIKTTVLIKGKRKN